MDEADAFMRETGMLSSIVGHAVAIGIRRAWSDAMVMLVVRHQADFVYVRGLLPIRQAYMNATSLERLLARTVEEVHSYASMAEFRSSVRLQYFEAAFRVEVARA